MQVKKSVISAAVALALTASQPSFAQQKQFSVPEQSATTAIQEFAKQAGVQIVAPSEALEGKTTRAVSGEMDASAALLILLEDTDLEVAANDGKIIVLRRKSTTSSSTTETLETVYVTGIAASLASSLYLKRASSSIVDVITAEDIGKFPDLNVSESLQRVPGVTLDRNYTGGGNTINLRGLGSQLTLVQINGMTGMSSSTDSNFGNSNGSRAFNFDILASELFANALVYKSASASQTEGGLAGIVELETPKPLEYEGFKMASSGMGNYSDKNEQWDPRVSFLISNNWNNVFGLAGSLAYSDTTYRADSAQGGSYRAFSAVNTGSTRATGGILNAYIPNGLRYIRYEDDRESLGLTGTLQYRPADTFELTAEAIYTDSSSERNITRDDAATESGVNAPISATVENGLITSGQFTGVQQRVGTNYLTTDETYGQLTLRGDWRPNESWSIKPFLGYANRRADRIWDLYSFRLADENGTFDPGVVSYTINGDFVDFSSSATDFSSNPQQFLFNTFIYRPSQDENTERAAKLDFERYFSADSPLLSLKLGARAVEDEKTTSASRTNLNRSSGVATTAVPNLGSVYESARFEVSGGGNIPGEILIVDPDRIASVFYPGGNPVSGTYLTEVTSYAAQNSYEIKETTFNGYVQASFEIGQAKFDVGVRSVHTKQVSSGYSVANANLATQTITPLSVSSTYDYYLPSANLRYQICDDMILRAAYSRTLTRPDLNQIAPSETVNGVDEGGGTGSKGNPYLEPYTADNYDLGLEWYFSKEGLIGATAFHKSLHGYIDTISYTETRSYPRQSDGVIVSGPIVFTQPVNGESAEISGFEFYTQSRFTFFPAKWLQNFGGILNYTYSESSAHFAQGNDVRNNGLPGLSKNSYNASLYYDDGQFSARLSYAWRSRYLANTSDDFGVARFRDAYGQFDLSANYNFFKTLSTQLQVLNITNEQFTDQSTANYYPYGVTDLDRRVLLGVRYAF